MAVLIYSQSFCQKSAERKSPKKYFLYFVLMSGLALEPCILPTRLRRLQEDIAIGRYNISIISLLSTALKFISLSEDLP